MLIGLIAYLANNDVQTF